MPAPPPESEPATASTRGGVMTPSSPTASFGGYRAGARPDDERNTTKEQQRGRNLLDPDMLMHEQSRQQRRSWHLEQDREADNRRAGCAQHPIEDRMPEQLGTCRERRDAHPIGAAISVQALTTDEAHHEQQDRRRRIAQRGVRRRSHRA